jgi:hypothetical protein
MAGKRAVPWAASTVALKVAAMADSSVALKAA